MNTSSIEEAQVEVMENSLPPVKYNVTDAALDELASKYEVVPVEDYDALRKGIAELRTLRTDVEKHRQYLKKDALEYGRLVDTEAKRITEKIVAIEQPMKDAKERIDAEKERIKAEKAEAEKQRIAAIREKIDKMKSLPVQLMKADPKVIKNALINLETNHITSEVFAEFEGEAALTQDSTIAQLKELHETRVAEIAEAKRLEEERAKLEAEKAEQERIRQEQEAEAKAKAEAEAAKRAEEEAKQRAEREKFEAEKREFERQQQEARAKEEARIEAEAKAKEEAERKEREEAEAKAAEARAKAEAEEAERKRQAALPEIERIKEFGEKLHELSEELRNAEFKEVPHIRDEVMSYINKALNRIVTA